MRIDNNEAVKDLLQEDITDSLDSQADEVLEDEEDTVKLYSKDGPVELFISEPYPMFPFYFFSASLLAAPLLYFTKGKSKDNKSILAEEVTGNIEFNHNSNALKPEDKPQSKPKEAESKDTEPKETEHKETEPKETEPKETEPKETEHKETEHKENEHKENEHKENEHKENEHKENEHKETEHKENEHKENEHKENEHKENEHKETEPKENEAETIQPETTESETTKPEETPPAAEEPKPDPVFTTKIYYKGELLVTKSTTPFNLQDLRYEERLENSTPTPENSTPTPENSTPTPKKEIKFHISKESADYNAYLAKINDYVYNHDSELNNKVTNAYKTDTDHDGLIDIHDKNPTTWDVSNRDLRMFSSLAYSTTDQIDKIFNKKDKPTMSSVEAEKLGGNVSIDELTNNWELLRHSLDQAGSGGLDYVIFGNGKNDNGTYKNVVVAFRGTNIQDTRDLVNDASILGGFVPSQANNLASVREIIKTYAGDKIYTTGHSLGGYLAQYFASNYLQRDSGLTDKFARSVLFNPAILKTRKWSHPDLKSARTLTDEFLITTYKESDKAKDWKLINKTNSYVIEGEFVHNTIGSYDNTTWINGETFSSLNALNKHKMMNFYSEDGKLRYFFEYGYRMDNHYLNKDTDGDGLYDAEERHIGTDPNNADTDNDGFSDKIEIALESDGTNAEATPNIAGKIINVDKGTSVLADDKPFVSIVTIEEEGKAPIHYAVTMKGGKEGDKIVYLPDPAHKPIKLENVPSISDEQERPTSVVSGTSNADQLYTEGNSYLTGNGGADTFIFKASAFNANAKPSHITDFNADDDKIDLSALKAVFSSASSNSSWNELFTTNNDNLESGKDYVIFNSNEHSLSYKVANSDAVVLAYFDNDAVLAANSIIG